MKKFIILIISSVIALSGCSSEKITENMFEAVWQEYLRTEFEESFDEKQSTAQKEKLMESILAEWKIDSNLFMEYFKDNHPEKYKKIFNE